MALHKVVWMPDTDGDPATPEVWMLPPDFDEQEFISAGSDPRVYNQRKMQSKASRGEPPGNALSNTSPPAVHRQGQGVSTAPPNQQPKLLYSQVLARRVKDNSSTGEDAQRVFPPMHTKPHLHSTDSGTNSQRAGHRSTGTARPPQTPQKANPGFSANYQGNTSLERNRSADIPADQNCSLFITGLPATVTVRSLLAAIRDTGRIYAVHINPPEPGKGHFTCAAKLAFFERRAAERFYDQCHAGGGSGPLHIAGIEASSSSSSSSSSTTTTSARVLWNRVRCAEADRPAYHTRVLLIAGPPQVADKAFLTGYFGSKFDFDIDEVLVEKDEKEEEEEEEEEDGKRGRALVEYRFGSYRCQAEAAKVALAREFGNAVRVRFGADPCDVTLRSWGAGSPRHVRGLLARIPWPGR